MKGNYTGPPKAPSRFSALVARSDGEFSRLYCDGKKYRKDDGIKIGHRKIHLTREDLGFMFTIWESERVYVRMPLSPELLAMKGRTFFPDERWIENGQQEIEGELCTVFQVDNPKPKVLPSESANALVVAYVSNDTKWMRRKEIFDGQGARRLVIDWLEVSFEPIPDEIFELPAMFDEISLRTGKPIRKGDS